MRTRLLTLVVAGLTIFSTGCASGIRIGGNHYGAGIGGYIGAVPDVLQHNPSYYPAPLPPPEPLPPR